MDHIGFFIMQDDIDPNLILKEEDISLEPYPDDIENFFMFEGFSYDERTLRKYHYNKQLSQIYWIAHHFDVLSRTSFSEKIITHILKNKIESYLYENILDGHALEPFYTVNRYGRNISIYLDESTISFSVKDCKYIYIKFYTKKEDFKKENVYVELSRVFNSNTLACHYLGWYLDRRERAFKNVLNSSYLQDKLLHSENFNTLIDFDSKVQEAEFSSKMDYYLTSERDVKRFLVEAEANIPKILEKNAQKKDEDKYYKSLGEKLIATSNSTKE